jgi:hypothetical protein
MAIQKTWEDHPDYAALWIQSCTRVGYAPFDTWMRHSHPEVPIIGELASRAEELHEAVLCKGMEAIQRESEEV